MNSKSLRRSLTGTQDATQRSDLMKLALSMCESGQLRYVSATCCRLRKSFTVPGENEWWNLDLDAFVLPATRLVGKCRLSQEPQLAVATVLAIDIYLCNSARSKDIDKTVTNILSTISKCWEWGRLNGIYRVEDWNASHFRRLEKQLAQGRWAVALQADSRIRKYLDGRPDPNSISRFDQGKFTIRKYLSRLLGTNLSIHELSCARNVLHRYVMPSPPASGWDDDQPRIPTGAAWLAGVFWHINLLSSVPELYRFKLTPFPNSHSRAKQLGKPESRTSTLSVDQAVGMLTYSMRHICQHSDAICDLVREAGRIVHQAGQAEIRSSKRLPLIDLNWAQSPVRSQVAESLGFNISLVKVRRKGCRTKSIREVVEGLISACFILIAGLNARRKDEIIHKSLGLHRDSMRPINPGLGVFEGNFYIEKTLKSYAPFFVNQATFDAFTALRKLEEAQLAVESLFTGVERSDESLNHSMFWIRSVSVTSNTLSPRIWFAFAFGSTAGRELIKAALGDSASTVRGGGHVFRRFYAIIYLYRFEHGGLLSLRYQLGHLNCEMTKQYVTSAMIEAVEARIPINIRRSPEVVRKTVEDDWQELDKMIGEVGSEKLLSSIVELLNGEAFSGGFPRLIERMHRKFLAEVDYSTLDTQRQGRRLQQRLISRGHALRPLPHADCGAGTSNSRGAKCSNDQGTGPAPENASAEICSTCPYSWTSKGHLEGLKLDLQELDKDVSMALEGTILRDSLAASRVNLQNAIWLHEQRTNRSSR